MRFFNLLKGGSTPKSAAKFFADQLVKRSLTDGGLCWEVAANFVMDCFGAIDIRIAMTPDDVERAFEGFQWPFDALRTYVFIYKPFLIPAEQFLFELCSEIQEYEDVWSVGKPRLGEDCESDTILTPIEWFMQLIGVWDKAYNLINSMEGSKYFSQYFQEPFARINYQLLMGVNNLRKLYRSQHPILDKICDRLLRSAQMGILYPRSHEMIAAGLIKMLHDDFHLFHECSPESTSIYYIMFTVEMPNLKHHLLYDHLLKLLKTYCPSGNELSNESENLEGIHKSLAVTNTLISSKMLNVYYDTLEKESKEIVLKAALKFLYVLQSKLIDLKCLPEAFIESILALTIYSKSQIANLAAKTYIAIMKRRVNENLILKHLCEFYFGFKNSPELIPKYTRRLGKYFPLVDKIQFFLELVQKSGEGQSKELQTKSLMGAHFLKVLFDSMLANTEENRSAIVNVLDTLLNLFPNIKCQITEDLLLEIFVSLSAKITPNMEDEMKEICFRFQEHAYQKLTSSSHIEFSLLKKWFVLWERLASGMGDLTKIEECVSVEFTKYKEILEIKNSTLLKLNKATVLKYCEILKRINLYFQSNRLQCDNDPEILTKMRKELMLTGPSDRGSIYDYAAQYNLFIDVYALESYAIFLIQKMKTISSISQSEIQSLLTKVEELKEHLLFWLRNTEELVKQPMVRIKSFFICLLELYWVFNGVFRMPVIILDGDTYELLIRILVHLIFKPTIIRGNHSMYLEKSQLHPLRTLDYKHLMIQQFTKLHTRSETEITNHYVWNLLLHYNLPAGQRFKNDIAELMTTLAVYRMDIFKNAIPIVVYNLPMQSPPLNDRVITNAMKAHKSFIDELNNWDVGDRAYFNFHIVLTVIDKIDKTLEINQPKNRPDRLLPLKYLPIFVRNLKLDNGTEPASMQIRNAALKLRNHLLNKTELKTLEQFLQSYNAGSAIPVTQQDPSGQQSTQRVTNEAESAAPVE